MTQNKFLVWCLFWGPFLIKPFMDFFHFPAFFKYLLDVAWVFLVATMITRKKKLIDQRVKFLMLWVFIFLLITLLNYIIHYQSIFYYLWGFRNNFRGYACFFATLFYFDEGDVYTALDILDKLFYIDVIVMLFQYFVLGYKQDWLGGLLGGGNGANIYANAFFCISLSIAFILFCEGKRKTPVFILQVALMLILAAMAEIKFFFVELVILMAVGYGITRLTWKKMMIVPIVAVLFFVGYAFLGTLFPGSDMNLSEMFDYASNAGGYTGRGDFNRLNFLGTSNSMFLTNTFDRLFGLGLGNCDYATDYAFVTSPFYRNYGYLNYTWFSSAFMYLENGWIGLIFFFGFFLFVFFDAVLMIYEKKGNQTFCKITALCAVAALMNGFYNQTLRMESGYMMYFMLAIPWCVAYEGNKMPKKRHAALHRRRKFEASHEESASEGDVGRNPSMNGQTQSIRE